MKSSVFDEQLHFVSRQLGVMGEAKGFDYGTALAQIERASDASMGPAIEFMRALPCGGAEGHSSGKCLSRLVAEARPQDKSLGLFFRVYTEVRAELYDSVSGFLTSRKTEVIYSASILCFAVLLFALYTIKVMPSMADVYTGSDRELPVLTQFVIDSGQVVFGLVFVLLAVALGVVFYVGQSLQQHARLLLPIPKGIVSLVAFGSVSLFNQCIVLSYMQLLLKLGESGDQAIQKATKLLAQSGASDIHLPTAIESSAKLNTLGNEVNFQLANVCLRLVESLDSFRVSLNAVFQAIIFMVVGAMIVAFYLPVFSLGEIF